MQHLKTGHHRGNSTERLLDVDGIITALGVKPGQTVLDAGCGNGYMSMRFADLVGADGRVIALDRFASAAELYNKDWVKDNVVFVSTDITKKTKLEDESVDLVYISTVYHVFTAEQRAGFNDEICRLLKPGGRLAAVELEKKPTAFGPPLERRVSPEELAGGLDLTPIENLPAGRHFYLQIFRKN